MFPATKQDSSSLNVDEFFGFCSSSFDYSHKITAFVTIYEQTRLNFIKLIWHEEIFFVTIVIDI